MFRQLLLQLVLILLNAFFAATEIAVISLNEMKVKAQADEGNKKALKMFQNAKNVQIVSNKHPLFHDICDYKK